MIIKRLNDQAENSSKSATPTIVVDNSAQMCEILQIFKELVTPTKKPNPGKSTENNPFCNAFWITKQKIQLYFGSKSETLFLLLSFCQTNI